MGSRPLSLQGQAWDRGLVARALGKPLFLSLMQEIKKAQGTGHS